MTTTYKTEPSMLGIMRRLSGAATFIANIDTNSEYHSAESVDRYKHFSDAVKNIDDAIVRAYAELSKLPGFEETKRETIADPYGDPFRDPEDLESDYTDEIRRCTREFVERAAALKAA